MCIYIYIYTCCYEYRRRLMLQHTCCYNCYGMTQVVVMPPPTTQFYNPKLYKPEAKADASFAEVHTQVT